MVNPTFAHAVLTRKISYQSSAGIFLEAQECQMYKMVTSVKFAHETCCVNTESTFNSRSLKVISIKKFLTNLDRYDR